MATRALTADDEPQLERFVLMAAFAPDRSLPEGARALAHVRRWLDGWSPLEPGVCWEEQDRVLCATWARRVEPILVRSAGGEPLREVVVAVDPARRKKGIGGDLLKALIARAREAGEPGLCLSVSAHNADAARLYERLGFTRIGRGPVGLETMALRFDE